MPTTKFHGNGRFGFYGFYEVDIRSKKEVKIEILEVVKISAKQPTGFV